MSHALVLILPFVLCIAAFLDLLTYKIPNRLSVILAISFLPAAFFAGLPPTAIAMHFAFGLAVLLIGFCLFSLGVFGGGDAKLLAAASIWFGGATLAPFLFAVAFSGGLLALTVVAVRSIPLSESLAGGGWVAKLVDPKAGIPYGIAIAAGGLLVFPKTPWITGLAAL